MNKENFILKNENFSLQIKSSKLEEEILSEAYVDFETVLNKYDKSFQTFLSKNIDKSMMTSMTYGVSINGIRVIGYVPK